MVMASYGPNGMVWFFQVDEVASACSFVLVVLLMPALHLVGAANMPVACLSFGVVGYFD